MRGRKKKNALQERKLVLTLPSDVISFELQVKRIVPSEDQDEVIFEYSAHKLTELQRMEKEYMELLHEASKTK